MCIFCLFLYMTGLCWLCSLDGVLGCLCLFSEVFLLNVGIWGILLSLFIYLLIAFFAYWLIFQAVMHYIKEYGKIIDKMFGEMKNRA